MNHSLSSRPSLALTCGLAALSTFFAGSASSAIVFGTGVTGTPTEEFAADDDAFISDVSSSDILNGLAPTSASGWFGSPRTPDKLGDGLHSPSNDLNNVAQSQNPPAIAEFDLGTGDNGLGYDLTSIISIAAWRDSGFGNQVWTLEVKGTEPTDTFSTLVSVDYRPLAQNAGQTSTKVTLSDLAGDLTSGVQFIRVTAESNANGANGRFIWQELDIFGESTIIPEPASVALLGIGGLLIGSRRRR